MFSSYTPFVVFDVDECINGTNSCDGNAVCVTTLSGPIIARAKMDFVERE